MSMPSMEPSRTTPSPERINLETLIAAGENADTLRLSRRRVSLTPHGLGFMGPCTAESIALDIPGLLHEGCNASALGMFAFIASYFDGDCWLWRLFTRADHFLEVVIACNFLVAADLIEIGAHE